MKSIKADPFLWLLIAAPVVIAGNYLKWNPTLIFFLSVLAIIPLAKVMGDATEALSRYTGPKVGGLLNASLGNAAELIITLVAIRAGLLDLVKASITGSIISNILLVTGAALLVGGLRNGIQRFDRTTAGLSATQLTLAVIALAIPAVFYHTVPGDSMAVEELSLGVAAVMIVTYVLNLVFGMGYYATEKPTDGGKSAGWSFGKSLLILGVDTLFIVWLSEIMVGAVEPTVASLGISEFFVGIIVIPIVGNAAENFVAITVAARDEMDLSLEIALGSSIQIALFVAPLLVFLSLFIGSHPLNLIFHPFELAALASSVIIAAFISQDGESNWMEGVQLISVFLIIALAFFFLPH